MSGTSGADGHSQRAGERGDRCGRTNIAGAGINMAQRVMDCGDAGHILLSQHVADDLIHHRQWAPRLRDRGDCEVKHGIRLHLVNLYAEPLGNAATPQRFKEGYRGHAVEPKIDRGAADDPLRTASHLNLALHLTALGRYDEAEAALRKAHELQPQGAQNYLKLAVIQILRGKPGAAVELAKQETDPFFRTYALALAQFANGDRAEADAALKKLIDENADDAGSQIATVYALRKEPEKMFEWLEHAWTTHDSGVTNMLADPFQRAYKDDPRFVAFAQKIGVMPKAGGKP